MIHAARIFAGLLILIVAGLELIALSAFIAAFGFTGLVFLIGSVAVCYGIGYLVARDKV